VAPGCRFWVDTADKQPCIGTGGMAAWRLKTTGKVFHSGLAHKVRGRSTAASIPLQGDFLVEPGFPLRSWWKVGTLLIWGATNSAWGPEPRMTKQRFLKDCSGTQSSGMRVVTWFGRIRQRRLLLKALSLLLVLFSGEITSAVGRISRHTVQCCPQKAVTAKWWYTRGALSRLEKVKQGADVAFWMAGHQPDRIGLRGPVRDPAALLPGLPGARPGGALRLCHPFHRQAHANLM
jgi:hypothetical protein